VDESNVGIEVRETWSLGDTRQKEYLISMAVNYPLRLLCMFERYTDGNSTLRWTDGEMDGTCHM
jgi:hypothetical protein